MRCSGKHLCDGWTKQHQWSKWPAVTFCTVSLYCSWKKNVQRSTYQIKWNLIYNNGLNSIARRSSFGNYSFKSSWLNFCWFCTPGFGPFTSFLLSGLSTDVLWRDLSLPPQSQVTFKSHEVSLASFLLRLVLTRLPVAATESPHPRSIAWCCHHHAPQQTWYQPGDEQCLLFTRRLCQRSPNFVSLDQRIFSLMPSESFKLSLAKLKSGLSYVFQSDWLQSYSAAVQRPDWWSAAEIVLLLAGSLSLQRTSDVTVGFLVTSLTKTFVPGHSVWSTANS